MSTTISSSLTRTPRSPSIWALVLLVLLTGCRKSTPRVISVELVELGDEGYDESFTEPLLLVTLDAELDPAELGDEIQLETRPRIELRTELVDLLSGPRSALVFRVLAGDRELRPEGLFRESASDSPDASSGIGVGIDGGEIQWVDVQPRRSHPELARAWWEDVNDDLVVDQGDLVHLVFTRPVVVDPNRERRIVEIPRDLVLRDAENRLDDGEIPSELLPSDDASEVILVLGSNPILVPGPVLERDESSTTSALALNATPAQPFSKIVDLKSGAGAISRGEVLVELPRDYPDLRAFSERFPESGGGTRVLPSASPFAGRGVLLAGGLSAGEAAGLGLPLAEIFFFDPLGPEGRRLVPVRGNASRATGLRQARYLHTASTLPGPDGVVGTQDDAVAIIGGSDSTRSLDTVEIIRHDARVGEFIVEDLAQKLRYPRFYHSATVLPGNRILVIGGLDRSTREEVVSVAELLSFEFTPAGTRIRGGAHRVEFRLNPRMRHTATRLGALDESPRTFAVLVYGGLGRDPYRGLLARNAEEVPSPVVFEPVQSSEAAILGSPEIVEIDLDALDRVEPAAKVARSTLVHLPFDYAHLRYGHHALRLGAGGDAKLARRVLIAGGSLRPPESFSTTLGQRPRREKWQLPRQSEQSGQLVSSWQRPRGDECASALVFDWSPSSPDESRIGIVPSTVNEARIHHALVPLSSHGVLVVGGENPRPTGERFVRSEIFLPGVGEWGRLSPIPLLHGRERSRFSAASLGPGRVYLFGGIATNDAETNSRAIQEIEVE